MTSPTPDTDRDDSEWAEALAGRPPEGMDPATQRHAELLRAGLRRRKASLDAEIEAPSETNFERLLFRLGQEGMSDHRRWNHPSGKHSIAWGIAASMFLTVALVFKLEYSYLDSAPNTDDQSLMRGDENITTLIVSDPPAFKQKISAALMKTDFPASFSTDKDGTIIVKVKATQSVIDALAEISVYPTLKNDQFLIIIKNDQ